MDAFIARQRVYTDVLVDGNNNFISNWPDRLGSAAEPLEAIVKTHALAPYAKELAQEALSKMCSPVSIYEAEAPYGPYMCANPECGLEFESLDDLVVEELTVSVDPEEIIRDALRVFSDPEHQTEAAVEMLTRKWRGK
jgi:hypothetical protein